jgi:uncharacterized protein DUF1524
VRALWAPNGGRLLALIHYVLAKIDEHNANGVTIDYSRMSIEHLNPLSPAAGLADAQVSSVGNLILAEPGFNNKLGNKPFSNKLAALKRSKIFLDPPLIRATTWTSAEITRRGEWLAECAYQKVWKV